MLEIIDSIFKGGNIKLYNMLLFPHSLISLISFLSKSNIHCKALRFNKCTVVEGDLMNELKKFVINNADKLSTLQYINLFNNYLCSSPWIVFCAVLNTAQLLT